MYVYKRSGQTILVDVRYYRVVVTRVVLESIIKSIWWEVISFSRVSYYPCSVFLWLWWNFPRGSPV